MPTSEATFHPDFNKPEDDIVLQSSDGVLFRIHSFYLKRASGVFDAMFAIPKPSAQSHTILLKESEQIIERCLGLITNRPLAENSFATLPVLMECARFFDKYEMMGCLSFLHIVFAKSTDLLLKEPLAVYKIACQYN